MRTKVHHILGGMNMSNWMENLKNKIYYGKATRADIARVTRRLGDEIAAVYGFDIPKQRTPQERGAR